MLISPYLLYYASLESPFRMRNLASEIRRAQSNPYYRPSRQIASRHKSGPLPALTEDKFEIILNVQKFRFEEIDVTVADGVLKVEAKHEENRDEIEAVSRRLFRSYDLPDNSIPDGISCHLSTDGMLTISVPLEEEVRSREVPIVQVEVPFFNFDSTTANAA